MAILAGTERHEDQVAYVYAHGTISESADKEIVVTLPSLERPAGGLSPAGLSFFGVPSSPIERSVVQRALQ